MVQYNVTGMSCSACSARVEKAVREVDGVTSCSVSLLTNSMGIEGTAREEDIIKAVTDAGYGASRKGAANNKADQGNSAGDTETAKMIRRLIASVVLLIPLMYVSMGHTMLSWPVPKFLDGNCVSIGIYELIMASVIMVINQKFFISGFKGAVHKAPNMDTLVSLGSGASFIYSVCMLFAASSAIHEGDATKASMYAMEYYFESAAMILALITIGKTLEAKSKGKTTSALKELIKLTPVTAIKLTDGEEKEVPASELRQGDYFAVKPGGCIPVDGIVTDGNCSVNEANLTGESVPADKGPGDEVFASTINVSGYIVCKATRVGDDTSLQRIIQIVSNATTTKAPVARVADKVSGVFVPAVIAVALITFATWMIAGQTFGYALQRAISVLVISCPCALGLATPVAIMVGSGISAKNGILFKTAVSLEQCGKVDIVALDKTGTVTKGEMSVKEIVPENGVDGDELLSLAAALEQKSEHPIAKAIVEYAKSRDVTIRPSSSFVSDFGSGVTCEIDGHVIAGGKAEIINKYCMVDSDTRQKADELSDKGYTPIFFSKDNELLGIIALADTIKDDSCRAIEEIKNLGIHTVLITGDTEKTARAIGAQAGIDEIAAGVLPEEKEKIVSHLKQYGKVAMVGDGVNDAPALTAADVSMAIGTGTAVAIDAAEVVLIKNSLRDVAAAIRISRQTLKNIHENLFWAFIYNVIGIPLAAGVFAGAFGWTLSPMIGAAAMSVSSFCVVSNALRLNLLDIYAGKKIRESKLERQLLKDIKLGKENEEMKYSVKGMMCPHCEAHVKEALEKIEGVTGVTADHENNLVTVESGKEIPEELIKAAVTGAGYEYCGKC